jgi:exodeoxyribonuclease-3
MPIDLKHDKPNRGKNGFTNEEREGFNNFLNVDFIDTFRHLYPTTIQYSWWSYRAKARENNSGWRIDYFLASKKLIANIKEASILDQVLGSDHCPVKLVIT